MKKPLPKKRPVLAVPTLTPSPAALYDEGRRIMRTLWGIVQRDRNIQGGTPDLKPAVQALFGLAHNATVNCAMAAHSPGTAGLAQEAANSMDWIAVLQGNRLPWFAGALAQLKTFHTYKSRGPHKKAHGDEKNGLVETQRIGKWVGERIESFWRGVISRGLRIPPIPDDVRAHLLARENRLKARAWASALLDDLPREPNSPHPFEVYDQGHNQAFFERQVPKRKRPGADRVRAGFVKFAAERFKPLLKAEVEQTKCSYEILMRERDQTNISPR